MRHHPSHEKRIKRSNTWHSPHIALSVCSSASPERVNDLSSSQGARVPHGLPLLPSRASSSDPTATRVEGAGAGAAGRGKSPRALWPSLPAAAVRRRVPTAPSGPAPLAPEASQGCGPGGGAAWPPQQEHSGAEPLFRKDPTPLRVLPLPPARTPLGQHTRGQPGGGGSSALGRLL